jgi:predicted  nucleic acid-binding Zn-ribbon protein
MSLEPETFRNSLLAINTAGTFLIGIWLYLERRNDKTNERVDTAIAAITALKAETEQRLDDHSTRLARLEAATSKAPTHADLSDLHEKINSVAGTTREIQGELRGISDSLRLILGRITEKGMQ